MASPDAAPERSRSIRVAIVDDHRLVLDGLSARLSYPDTGIEVVASEETWAGLLANPAYPVDVVVLDLHLGDSIPIGTKIRGLRPSGARAVVISRHVDQSSIAAALRAGALGFVSKTETAEELIAAVHAAAASAQHLSEELRDVVDSGTDTPDAGLGARELDALVLYANGRSVREVAAEMNTTEETVKSYIKRGRRKYKAVGIDVSTRVLLRRHGRREGWVSGP